MLLAQLAVTIRRRTALLFGAAALFTTLLPFPVWSQDDALIVGVFPRRSATTTVNLFTPLVNYLSDQLKRPVELVTAKDFESFWQGVKERRYDLVHFNQYHYIKAHEQHGYQVIVSNMEFGSGTLAGAVYVRKDSGIEELTELHGKRIIFGGGPDAMMSYIVQRYLLEQAGVKEGEYDTAFAINPPNSVYAVYYRQSDASGAGDVVIRLPAVKKQIDTSELKIIATSMQLRHLPWAVKDDLPESLRQTLQTVMLALNESEEGKAILRSGRLTGFEAAQDSDYADHRAIVEAVYGAERP